MNAGGTRVADRQIGPVEVRIGRDEVMAYAAATAIDPGRIEDHVPATFPAIWLWHPLAQSLLSDGTRQGERVPILTAQRFEYRSHLRVGAAYRFEIDRFADVTDPDMFLIEARVTAVDEDRLAATFVATYRMVDLRGQRR